MPEGHLIHRFAADHGRRFVGDRIRVSSPQGRFGEGARRLDGRVLQRVEAYGKHLFYWWHGGEVLHVHLGTQGKFLPARPNATLRQSRMRMEVGDCGMDLVAPIACELVDPGGRDRIVSRLGPDPLRDDADPELVRSAIAASHRPVGAMLLDQAIVSGIGNVLRAEAPFVAGIHPARHGSSLTTEEFRSLWSHLVVMMRLGAAEGRIITVRPPGRPAATVPEAEGRYVYKQQRCRRCATPVQMWRLAGRTAYACPRDQPPPAALGSVL